MHDSDDIQREIFYNAIAHLLQLRRYVFVRLRHRYIGISRNLLNFISVDNIWSEFARRNANSHIVKSL